MLKSAKKILYFGNIIAPYNIEYFNALHKALNGSILFYFDQYSEANRAWKIDNNRILFEYRIENSWKIEQKSTTVNQTTLFRTTYFPFFVLKRVRQYRPSVVLSIEFGFRSLFALFASKLTGAKFLLVSDVTTSSEAGISLIRKLLRKTITRFSDGAVARSYQAKNYLISLGFLSDQIQVAPYAVAASEKVPCNKKDNQFFTLLYVGHFEHHKGIDLLISTVEKLPATYKNRLKVVMAGGTNTMLAAIKPDYNSAVFHPLGFLQNAALQEWYQQSDAMILPSRQDTWGLVINEAVQNNCPVLISTHAGAAGELIRNQETGLVFDPLDEAAFLQALTFAMDHPLELKQLAENAKELLKEYNYEVAAARTVTAIHRVQYHKNKRGTYE